MTTYTAHPDMPQKTDTHSRQIAEAGPGPQPGAGPHSSGLTSKQVAMIEEAMGSLGEYGEIHLIIEKGRLRFLVTQKSYDALKWTPGCIAPDEG